MRIFVSAVLAAILLGTGARADPSLRPGKPAGVSEASSRSRQTTYIGIGIGIGTAAIGLALIHSEGSANAATSSAP